MARTKVLISYAHVDKRWLKRVTTHLKVLERTGLLEVWDDRRIGPGQEWRARIHEHLLSMHVAVLLISADFLTSDFILDTEVPKIFDKHAADGMTIYPFLIRACPWQEVPWLARMQIRPENAKPVASFRPDKIDEVLADFAREIADIARAIEPT